MAAMTLPKPNRATDTGAQIIGPMKSVHANDAAPATAIKIPNGIMERSYPPLAKAARLARR